MIGIVTTSYPLGPDDGAGGFVRERVRELRRQGQAVEIIAAGDATRPNDDAVTRIKSCGLFYSGGAPEALEDARHAQRIGAWAKACGFSLAMLGQLVSRRNHWHAVESHWLVPCSLLATIALPGIPHRSHVHGGDLALLRRLPMADSLARNFCRTGPEIVFASRRLQNDFAKLVGQAPEWLGERCRVEPAPFDKSIFVERSLEDRHRLRASLGLDRPTVLAAGRLVPIKGFDVLVAAMATIPAAVRPDLLIAGDGPELQRLTRQSRVGGVHARFLGNLGQRTLADTMAAADLLVHPCRILPDGRSEGMPLVVREARACGLRVVASASGGLRELRDLEGYAFVAPDDVPALAVAIRGALG